MITEKVQLVTQCGVIFNISAAKLWFSDHAIDHFPQTTHTPANTKHLYNICTMLDQRRRRWTDVVEMLCKCFFVFLESTCGRYLKSFAFLDSSKNGTMTGQRRCLPIIELALSNFPDH